MYKIADIQDYRKNASSDSSPFAWMDGLAHILETRYHDEDCIQQMLTLATELTGLSNISVAIPDSPSRFKAQYCSTGITNGVYSFAVQHALCRQFESREWLVIQENSERPERFDPQLDKLTGAPRCLLVPLTLRQSVLAVMVLDLRGCTPASVDVTLIHFIGAQIANILATQVVPNFKTLYARPYQRVQEDELGDIYAAIDKCNGNKTMAAKVLGLTPRQLRYRLSKLGEEAEA
ncbi:GAF domain-containing protein [Thalassolituus sp.]|jgi:transcriptional regulator with GAF, ATPase, and Fis domain|uniref:GAF domain-containing protein n=1 Tax=Thalassolituus sp. TaxID=2030822 RepID=UPI0026245A14|nr:helix-turn-helix domain-containing protein [uncultured Thalassolituus sp.]